MVTDANGVVVAGVSQGAMQMGRHAATVIERELGVERLARRLPAATKDPW